MTTTAKQPLTNVQLELLRLYAANISDETLLEMKKILARFFLDKTRKEASTVWQENNYTDDFFIKID
jgi:hypothetical protein